jgi:hypothetical protein
VISLALIRVLHPVDSTAPERDGRFLIHGHQGREALGPAAGLWFVPSKFYKAGMGGWTHQRYWRDEMASGQEKNLLRQ